MRDVFMLDCRGDSITYVQRNGFLLDLEIKPTPGAEAATGVAVARACVEMWRGGVTAPPLLSSVRPEALQGAREAAPELPRALLADTLWPGWFEMARALDCLAVITHHQLMDAGVIGQLHDAGMRALCYTVNEPPEARRLLALGIDGIITDAVDRFSPDATRVFD